jgi:hypothetical protein
VQRFDDERGDNTAHDVTTAYRRTLASGVRARAEYGYVDGEYTDFAGAARLRREHRIEAGPEFEKAFSRRRRVRLSLGLGASYLESIRSTDREPYHVWVPTGSGRATLAISPVWSVEGGYTRGFSLLQGLTDETYTTDTAFLTTGGLLSARTHLRVDATYSNGRAPLASGADGTFDVYGASLQMRVALTKTVAASAGYFYYHQFYSNPGTLPTGFPAEYDRHAVRVGLTVMLPLVGTSSRSSLTPR